MTDETGPAPAFAGFWNEFYAYLIDQSIIQLVVFILMTPKHLVGHIFFPAAWIKSLWIPA